MINRNSQKRIKSATEFAYLAGLVWIAVGTGMITRANFGVGIVVAPAYIIHKFLYSLGLTFFTFGVCQYLFQGLLLVIVSLVCMRFKRKYIFAFASAVFEGYLLDCALWLLPAVESIFLRVIFFIVGQLVCSLGVSFMMKTYITPEAYEVAVYEFTERFYKVTTPYTISVVKTVYDCSSGVLAVVLSICFFEMVRFSEIGIGTIISAVVGGWLTGVFTKIQDAVFEYSDCLKLRRYFN